MSGSLEVCIVGAPLGATASHELPEHVRILLDELDAVLRPGLKAVIHGAHAAPARRAASRGDLDAHGISRAIGVTVMPSCVPFETWGSTPTSPMPASTPAAQTLSVAVEFAGWRGEWNGGPPACEVLYRHQGTHSMVTEYNDPRKAAQRIKRELPQRVMTADGWRLLADTSERLGAAELKAYNALEAVREREGALQAFHANRFGLPKSDPVTVGDAIGRVLAWAAARDHESVIEAARDDAELRQMWRDAMASHLRAMGSIHAAHSRLSELRKQLAEGSLPGSI
ncbi:MAG: hypothetical protein ACU85V_00115 [Gammaproteobacteria bacterium]